MKFSDLNLIPEILWAADEAGYVEPSPVQEMAIGPVLDGRDLVGCAQTGTGKTAAFAMPVLQLLAGKSGGGKRVIRALVLTPTRELALQIHESFQQYGKHLPLRCVVVFGGVGQGPQVEALKRGTDILIATPGRLTDLQGQGHIDLSHVEIFVLDEADRMLDMGFIRDVRRIQRMLPEKRQNLLFSATMPQEIRKMIATELNHPIMVSVTPDAPTVEEIEQQLYTVDRANKRHLLVHLLRDPAVENALVFTRTKHGADRVVRELRKAGIQAMSIHGDKSQNARQEALSRFKKGTVKVLVATDIAARGLDISGLSHVFNYDLPNEPETYVHRIGRTGRAGHSGVAISFCCYDELEELRAIEKLIRREIPEVSGHPWPMEIFEESRPAPRLERSRRDAGSGVSGQKTSRKQESSRPSAAEKQEKQAVETPAETSGLSRSARRRRNRKARKATQAVELPAQQKKENVAQTVEQGKAAATEKKKRKAPKKKVNSAGKTRKEPTAAAPASVQKEKGLPRTKKERETKSGQKGKPLFQDHVPVTTIRKTVKPKPMDQPLRRGGYSSGWN